MSMEPATLFAFALLSAVNALMPGPVVATLVGRAALGGVGDGLRVILGTQVSAILLVSVALAVVAGVVTISPGLFRAMEWAGIGVMVWLGLGLLRPTPLSTTAAAGGISLGSGRHPTGAGFFVGLASPYNLLFYTTVLPQFVPEAGLSAVSATQLLVANLLGEIIPQTGLALAAGLSLRRVEGADRWVSRAGAVSLLGFAAVATVTSVVR